MLLAGMLALQPVRVAVLGDRTGGADDRLWRETIGAIALMRPDLVISVGDLIEGYCDSASAAAEWPSVMESLRPLSPFGIVAAPGNHDIWDRASENLWREVTGWPVEGVVQRRGIDLVLWDTSRESRMTAGLLDRLDSLLEERQGPGPTVVVTHRPLWAMADADSSLAAELYGLLGSHGVDAVLSGHVHASACSRRGEVLLATVGSSGTRMPEVSPDGGLFTQFGWLTLGEGPAGFALIESEAVHSESLNTPVEQRLRYLYTRRMLDPGPLDPGGGDVAVILHPFEDRERQLEVEVQPEGWPLTPAETRLSLGASPDTLMLRAGEPDRMLPLPRLRVRLRYGPRDKELELVETLPLARPVPAALCEAEADGVVRPGEYPAGPLADWIGRRGGPSGIPPTEVGVAVGADSIRVAFECSGRPEEDEAGLFLSGGGRSLMLFAGPDGGARAYAKGPGGSRTRWEEGWSLAVVPSDGGWVLEAAVDLGQTGGPEGMRMNVFRSAGGRLGCWCWPPAWDARLMGRLETASPRD